MLDTLLISEDPRIISEIQKITAVTQCSLEITAQPNFSQLRSSKTVLVDTSQSHLVDHPNVVLLTFDQPDTNIWQKAAETKAKYVAFLPDAREWLLQNLVAQPILNRKVIGVVGSSGGLGSSLIASILAIESAKQKQPTLLIETDRFSGGLDVLWGIEEVSGTRWPDLKVNGELTSNDLIQSFPNSNNVSILSTDSGDPRLPDNFVDLISDLSEQAECTVIDLLDPIDPNFLELINLCTEVIVVVGGTIRSTNAANQLIGLISPKPISGIVVRKIPGSGLDALSIAKTLDCQLLAQINTDPKITEHIEQGLNLALLPSGNYLKSISEILNNLEN